MLSGGGRGRCLLDSWLGPEPLKTFPLARGSRWPEELWEPGALPELPSEERPLHQGPGGLPTPPPPRGLSGPRPPQPPPQMF